MCVQSELPRVHGMCGIYSDSGVRSQMNGKLQRRMYLTLKGLFFQMHEIQLFLSFSDSSLDEYSVFNASQWTALLVC